MRTQPLRTGVLLLSLTLLSACGSQPAAPQPPPSPAPASPALSSPSSVGGFSDRIIGGGIVAPEDAAPASVLPTHVPFPTAIVVPTVAPSPASGSALTPSQIDAAKELLDDTSAERSISAEELDLGSLE